MPNDYLDKVTLNGTTYDIKDTVSGYTSNVGTVTGVKINTTTKSPDSSGTVDLGTVVTSESDPTVPAWAKASSKPTYTASEVGAVPTSRTVNGKALSSNITLSASDVGALPDSTVIPTVVDTYSSTGTDAVSGKGVAAALGTLDSSIPDNGEAISGITITDGKITSYIKTDIASGYPYWLTYGDEVDEEDVITAIEGGRTILLSYETNSDILTIPLSSYSITPIVGGNALTLEFIQTNASSALDLSFVNGISIIYDSEWSISESSIDTTVVDTYSSTGTQAISGTGVAAALGTLDSGISATTGQAISAITITNGKINASSKISVGDANQNAFSNVKVGSTTISADTTTDTLELAASGLVSLTPDATNDKVTISASYTETDPTVPSWAKASTKPTYTASEVGAVPTSRTVNGKALSSDITLSASDVSALPSSTVIPTVVDTYSSSGTDAISGKGVAAALGTLDSGVSATTGQAISAITITDGKIINSSKISVGDANQNAFSNIVIGRDTIAADTTTDTVELVADGLVSLTADTTNDKVTISASYTETDPTVPSWAKASTKPTYTASEVGAVPTSRKVNGKALSADISLTASDVGALPDSTVIPQGTVTSVATGTGLTGGTITASGTISLDGTYGLTTSDITTGTDTTNKLISAKTLADTLGGLGGGTITGVTAGTGLSGGGTSGGVTLNHSNSVTAQSTKGIYPIAIDAQGHISDYDAAITPADGNSTGAAERTAAIPFAKVDSTSTSTAFTATVPGITELVDGTCCYLMNGVVTSAAGWTLNVNGLGAKPVYQTLAEATVTTTIFNVNYTMLFVYNSQRISGGCWDIFYGYNSNTTYTNASLGQGYGTCATAAATKAKTVTLSSYSLTTGGVVAVKFTYDVPAGATMNVNSKGAKAIYYHGAAITDGIIKAGDVAYFIYSTYYHLLGVDDVIHPASSVTSLDGISVTGTSIDYARADHKHSLTSGAVTGALGYTPYNSTNPSGYITGISSTDVTNALGYTPYNSTNPSGYITSASVPTAGTTATAVGTSASGGSATTWSKSDHVHSLSSSTITSALGYTPYNSTNPDGYITANDVPKETMIVNVTLTSTTAGTSDKTAEEIATAASQGILPVAKVIYGTAILVASLSGANYDQSDGWAVTFTAEDQFDYGYARLMIFLGNTVAVQWLTKYLTDGDNISSLTNNVGYITSASIPTAGTTATAVSTSASGGSATTWSKSDHVHSISSSTITSALGYTPYNNSNPDGYLTSSTLPSALEANSAIIYEITYTEPTFWASGIYAIADTLANVTANISSARKVIFRQSLTTGKYNYWQPWFNNPNSSKIGLYRFEKDGGKLYHVVFEPDSGGTGLTGTEVSPYYLSQYDPYAVGKIITTGSINDDPNDYLDGTWTLIDKEFTPLASTQLASSAITLNTTNADGLDLYFSRTGHEIAFTGYLSSKVSISNTNLEMVQSITLSSLGANAFNFTPILNAQSDSKHAIIFMDMDKSSGRIRTLDVVVRGTGTSITATSDIAFQAVVTCHYTDMVDSACGKFYWKRTA